MARRRSQGRGRLGHVAQLDTRPFYALPALTFATLPPAVAGTQAYITDGAAGNCGDSACTRFGTTVTGGGGALKLLLWNNAKRGRCAGSSAAGATGLDQL